MNIADKNKEDDENGSTPVTRGSAPVAQADLEKLGPELGGMTKDTQQRILVSGDGFDELWKEEKASKWINYKKIIFYLILLYT